MLFKDHKTVKRKAQTDVTPIFFLVRAKVGTQDDKGVVLRFNLCFFWLFSISLSPFAQGTTFYVKAPDRIQLIPDIDTLLGNEVYHFQIKDIAMKNINRIEFDGGKAFETDSDVIVHTLDKPSVSRKYILRLYDINDEKVVHSLQKSFTILIKAQLPAAEKPDDLSGFHVDSAWKDATSGRIMLKFKLASHIGDTIKKEDIIDTINAALRALSFYAQSGPPVSVSMTVRISKTDASSNDYPLTNKFALNTELKKQLSELRPGCQVEILKIKFCILNQVALKPAKNPCSDIFPYSFIIKQ